VCLMWAYTLCADAEEGTFCVSIASQNNKETFCAIETTYWIFIAYFFCEFIFFSHSSAISVVFWTLSFLFWGITRI
jgi:hypothetical protein